MAHQEFGPDPHPLLGVKCMRELCILTSDTLSTIRLLQEAGLLKTHRRCSCRAIIWCITKNRAYVDGYAFRCYNRCRKTYSVREHSFFDKSHLTLGKILEVVFCWALKVPPYAAIPLTGLSKPLVLQWYRWIREVCAQGLVALPPESFRFGGPGVTVQVDESVVAKRKFHRGRRVPEQWVFGGYDTTKKQGFVFLVDGRRKQDLVPLIEEHVLPGTTLYTDEWPSPRGLSHHEGVSPWEHKTVNHSEEFVDPITGATTNAVEAYRSRSKRSLRYNGTFHGDLSLLVDEFMWRERFEEGNPLFAWRNILILISRQHPRANN